MSIDRKSRQLEIRTRTYTAIVRFYPVVCLQLLARLWILAPVPLLAPLYSCAGAGGGGRAVNCDIIGLQRQEGLPPSQIAASFQVSEADIAKCPNASPAGEAAPPR
jgi:hypothetical protein